MTSCGPSGSGWQVAATAAQILGISSVRRSAIARTAAAALMLLYAPARAQDPAAGQRIFRSQCTLCHAAQPGRNLVGPSLFGVVGRPSGTAPGYHFSPAMSTAHLTWDAATLNRYLENPRGVVPGTLMAYVGIKDPKQRADLIAYLATLH
jgi:cytochrome c